MQARPTQAFRVMGLHLSGTTHARGSALVRASVHPSALFTGAAEGHPEHSPLKAALAPLAPHLPVLPLSAPPPMQAPLLWEAFLSGLSPKGSPRAEEALLEAIENLGGAEVFVLDVPLTLPPCTTCPLPCPGTTQCEVPEVGWMRDIHTVALKGEKRQKALNPQLDRAFEVFARQAFEHPSLKSGCEFEALLSANRAPLVAKARRLKKRILHRWPKARVFETNAMVAAVGWSHSVHLPVVGLTSLRTGREGWQNRQNILSALEQQQLALRSPGLHPDIWPELGLQLELFQAAMGCLGFWALLHGQVALPTEWVSLRPDNPWDGWSLLPKNLLILSNESLLKSLENAPHNWL